MNEQVNLWVRFILRTVARHEDLKQMAEMGCELGAITVELSEISDIMLAVEAIERLSNEEVCEVIRRILASGILSEAEQTALESALEKFLRLQAQAQTERCVECRCRHRLDPGGGPLPPDDRDLDDPW